MAIINDLRSIEEIENGIKKLLSIKSSENDAYQKMYDVILNDLHPIPFPIIDLVPDYEYSHVYRARRNIKKEVFKEITDISSHCNPKDIIKYGRCNIPGQSTFYGAENRPTSNMEVINKEILDNSEYIILTNGRWKIKKRIRMGILVHGKDVIKVNPYIKQKYDEFQAFLNEGYPQQQNIINRLLQFISDYFSRPFDESVDNEYKLSAAFYNYILKRCDGLIYPSVKIIYEGLNYAFPHNKFTDNYIELDRALINVLKKEEDGNFKDFYFTEDRGVMKETNEIKWNSQSLPFNKLPALNNDGQ